MQGKTHDCACPSMITDLNIFFQIIHDIRSLEQQIDGDFLQHVLQILSSCSSDVIEMVRQSISQGSQSLKDLEPLVIKTVVESLVEKSVEVN